MPKKSRREDTNMYPRLEYESASRVLHYWGISLASPDTSEERKTELRGKLAAVQRAVAIGIGSGAQADWPDELVIDEHDALKADAICLRDSAKKLGEVEGAAQILSARREYFREDSSGRELILARPLWLSTDEDKAAGIALSIRTNDYSHDQLRLELVAQLFDYEPGSLAKIVADSARPSRPWKRPSQVQLYLVAMFIIGARSGIEQDVLLRILDALEKSGYPAIALYHLSKAANRKFPEIATFEFPTQDVRDTCTLLDKLETQAGQ
jgi:hypothetical protein